MPLKAPESYELDRSDTPFIDRKSFDDDSDLSDIDGFDPLKNSRRRYTDDASQPLRSVFDSDKNLSFSEKPLAWLDQQRKRGSWQTWLMPSKFGCALVLLFVATLVLLLSAGGIWVYKSAGVPETGESEPWYPSPRGGSVESWHGSYQKAAELVRQMTLIEKVNVTTGTGWMMGPCVGNTGPVDRIGFPSLCLQDGPLGMRFVDNGTSFPAGITVGATWNKELMYARGRAHGFEANMKGINVLLGPSMGAIGRLPGGGRNWEGFGSDPVLQGVAAAQTIKGIQDSGVIATAKHFVGNEQEHFRQSWEWGTPNAISSNIDDRTLHEIYAWPFADSIRAGVASVMCSYNQVNNSYACQNSKLMNGILKDEMGFQGFIQSDWLAQRSGVGSALAGLDMSMPGDGLKWQDGETLWGGELTKAILNGSVPIERVDDMVLRIVATWYKLGQNDTKSWPKHSLSSSATFSSWTYETEGKLHPGSNSEDRGVVNQFVPVRITEKGGDHDELARKIAAEGIVMVKNHDNVLPIKTDGSNILSRRHGKNLADPVKVAIFGEDAFSNPKGPNACVDRACNEYTLASGWGSGASDFPYLVAPFDALNASFDHSAVEITAYDQQTVNNAGGIAEDQDLCIVFANADAGEGFLSWDSVHGDREDLTTQKYGDALIQEVAKRCGNANSEQGSAANTVVVLHAVGPVIMERWIDLPEVKAVLLAHLPGQESGNALADIIFGKANPSGRLPYTIAKHEDDYGPTSKILTMPHDLVPQQNFSEGLYFDYRYFDKHEIEPRYEFGYGLSYTQFHLSSPLLKMLNTASSPVPSARPAGLKSPMLDSKIPDPATAIFPKGFKKLTKYIYPYINSASDGRPNGEADFPYDPENPHSLSPAGGGEGGNPDLWTPIASMQATLTNLGNITGSCVVQMYISYPPDVTDADGHPVDMPVKVLRGFEKVEVGTANEAKRKEVRFELTRRDLSFWDVKRQNWVLPRGDFVVRLGFSSRDLPVMVGVNPFGLL